MENAESAASEVLSEFERRNRALQLRLKALEESLEDTASARNDAHCQVETSWEAGIFKADGPFSRRPTAEELEGFIIRARSDAMAAKLNSAQTLDEIEHFKKQLRRMEQLLGIGFGATIGLLLLLVF
ncbi:MAG: hypothetical protein WAT78_08025 [Rhizobiaceae bacterium]